MSRREERAPLTRAIILAAAVRVVDEDGLTAISMRKLATELGVGTMSLYNHVPNKEALLRGIAQAVLTEIEVGDINEEPIEVLLTTARSFRRALLAHPDAARLVMDRSAGTPEGFPPREAILGAFRRLGLGPKASFYAQQATLAFVVGHVLFELENLVFTADDHIPRDEFPNLGDLQAIVSDLDSDRSFEFGLEGLLEGLLEHEGE